MLANVVGITQRKY